ncbi:MAG: LapA family protein [Desulfovibrio sp.]|nr:LapA family protein [Desulfovibrio sp.]
MRYIKVLLLAIFFFLALVFFFQNQTALSQSVVLTLNLFFLPAMSSIALPFYFLIIAGFACGALLTLAFLVWDKLNSSAKLVKQKWQINSLERAVAKGKKKVEAEAARAVFLEKTAKEQQTTPSTDDAKAVATNEHTPDDGKGDDKAATDKQ